MCAASLGETRHRRSVVAVHGQCYGVFPLHLSPADLATPLLDIGVGAVRPLSDLTLQAVGLQTVFFHAAAAQRCAHILRGRNVVGEALQPTLICGSEAARSGCSPVPSTAQAPPSRTQYTHHRLGRSATAFSDRYFQVLPVVAAYRRRSRTNSLAGHSAVPASV